jgi:hypothetical protein
MAVLKDAASARSLRRASVWIDSNQAVITRRLGRDPAAVEVLIREPAETEAAFDSRSASEVTDADEVLVAGTADHQAGFDRAFVALTRRPERLVAAWSVRRSRPRG